MSKEVTISKLDHFGRGIFFDDNKISFVPYALPEEIVNVSKVKETSKYNLYYLNEIIKKSSRRVKPLCPYFGKCGGCDLQHMSYKDTLDFKLNKIKEIFKKFKIDYNDITIEANPSPYNYRNKIELKCIDNKIGFYKIISHELVEIDERKITASAINNLLKELHHIILPDCDIVIRVNYNDELLLWIKTDEEINISRDMFSNNLKIASIIINNNVIYGEDHLIMQIDNHLFKCSYDAFFQINPYICEKVSSFIKENIIANSVIADLYCGVGFLGILAASKAKKVYGIEIIENAIKDALINQKINKIDNMYFMLGDVFKIFDKINDNIDYLIVDPPRSGLGNKTIDNIIKANIPNILYMSCDPNTLARDLSILKDRYNIKKVKCFDMFSYTYHLESIVILERKKRVCKYTSKEEKILKQCDEGPVHTILYDITNDEFNLLVDKLIKDDDSHSLRSLVGIYWDYNRNRIIDYYLCKDDPDLLISFLDLCNDFSSKDNSLDQTYLVSKLLDKNDMNYLKQLIDNNLFYYIDSKKEQDILKGLFK